MSQPSLTFKRRRCFTKREYNQCREAAFVTAIKMGGGGGSYQQCLDAILQLAERRLPPLLKQMWNREIIQLC